MTQEALKLALEWFKCYADHSMSRNNAEALADEVVEAIEKALAQTKEPIAMLFGSLPVYDRTTPPQRLPLTFWQKDEMTFKAKISQEMSPVEIYLQGISDAEAAHSIKE